MLFNVGLRIHAMGAAKLLGDWILNLDCFDSLIEGREIIDPIRMLLAIMPTVHEVGSSG